MDTKSQHLMLDAEVVGGLHNNHVETIKKIIRKNFTVVKEVEYKFTPQGETIVFILSESHFSLHTYPEFNYFTMDVYICNLSIDLNITVKAIESEIPLKNIKIQVLNRGDRSTNE